MVQESSIGLEEQKNDKKSEHSEDIYLNDTWSFYFHDPQNEDWRQCSYEKICNIATAEDYWLLDMLLKDNISKGMFFLMRENVFPCWDDEANIQGGCLSIKVLKQELQEYWNTLVSYLLTENILCPEKKQFWNKVNGISTSPKKHFCIVKIWVSSHEVSDQALFQVPSNYNGEVIYKSNIDNISMENRKYTNQRSR